MAPPEFTFELRVCRWAERAWPPDGRDAPAIVARQLGTARRRWDTVVVEVDPVGLAARAAIDDRALTSDLLHVARNAPDEWAWYRDALPEWCPWRYVREAVHEAADRGVVETRRDGNRLQLRGVHEYPDWIRRIVAIENKPDLDAGAARALRPQLEHDLALGLADEVWVATRATDDAVEPILLDDFPVDAGVLVLDPDPGAGGADSPSTTSVGDGPLASDPASARVAWEPRGLDVDAPGTRITDRPAGGAHDASAARFEYVDPEAKDHRRHVIAERAFARGWRSHLDTMRPDCRWFEGRHAGATVLPWCAAKERHQTAAECSGACPEFEPEPPPWRSRGPPLEGGPGAGIRRLLERRRERERERVRDDDGA
jgi:hypothetical protein